MDNLTKNRLLIPMNFLYKISPKLSLEILYKLKTGYTLNLNKPVTYNEKLQWIKLYDKNPLMPFCCDKFLVREYVRSRDCGDILNELFWEGFDPEDIPFERLPNQFIIKVTHGSSFNVICKNKEDLNREKTRDLLNKWLNMKFLPCYGEWFYGVERPRVIVEKYLENKDIGGLLDYKVFCFHGKPRLIYVMTIADRKAGNIYDVDFNFIPNVKLGGGTDLTFDVPKPDNLDEMLDYARKLSRDFIHVRVDLYNINRKVVFGELSFTKGAGFSKITPHSFDIEMGSWLTLPDKMDLINWRNEHE